MDDRELLLRLASGVQSGDALAREAGLTRAAVWKRIQGLRAAGIGVAAAAGRGYALERPLDLLDADRIRAGLPAALRDALAGLEVAWALDSTNSELLRRPRMAGPGVEVLLAERQSAGRGRLGRAWVAPLGAQVCLSLRRGFGGTPVDVLTDICVSDTLHERLGPRWVGVLIDKSQDAGLLALFGSLQLFLQGR